jgi:glutamate-ammonia-ligase adenylyltransferase
VRERVGPAGVPGRVALLGLGRLGARELDYAPDVDLLVVYEPDVEGDPEAHAVLRAIVQEASDALARAAAAGDLYRAELPARPAALSGAPAASLRRWQAYCANLSDHRLRLAFVRARALGGDAELGARAVSVFGHYAYDSGPADGPLVDLRRRLASGEASADDDVRDGAGGISDLEEFTATMRLVAGRDHPDARVPGTLDALATLVGAGVLTHDEGARLAEGFSLLRRVEQRLYLTRGEVPPTLDDPAALDLVAAGLGLRGGEALRERLLAERIVLRAICRAVLERR